MLAIQRENTVCYRRGMTQALSQHISFKHFKKYPVIWTFRCGSVSCQSLIWPYIVVGWTSREVLWLVSRSFSRSRRGSIPFDSQNPPCWGALQQDFLAATGMQLWRGAVQKDINPDKTPVKKKKKVHGRPAKKSESGSTSGALHWPIKYVQHTALVVDCVT